MEVVGTSGNDDTESNDANPKWQFDALLDSTDEEEDMDLSLNGVNDQTQNITPPLQIDKNSNMPENIDERHSPPNAVARTSQMNPPQNRSSEYSHTSKVIENFNQINTLPQISNQSKRKINATQNSSLSGASRTNTSDLNSIRNMPSTSTFQSDGDDIIILSLVYHGNKLGAAYYNIITSQLHVLNDISDTPNYFPTLRCLFKFCDPRYVILTHDTDKKFINSVKALIISDSSTNGRKSIDSNKQNSIDDSTSHDSMDIRITLNIVSKREFNYDSCYHRVKCLKLESEPTDASHDERFMFLMGQIDFSNERMIFALGLLLRFLDKKWSSLALAPAGTACFVDLNHVALSDIVMVNEETYDNLKITNTRSNPVLVRNDNSKSQPYSLFNVLNYCLSKPGVKYLWKILRQPTRNLQVLNRRFEIVQFFSQSANQSVFEGVRSCFKGIYNLTNNILNQQGKIQTKASDWHRLYKTLTHIICISEICRKYKNHGELFLQIAESVPDEIVHIKYFIECIVDFEEGKHNNTFVVKPGVDSDLDGYRRIKEHLPEILTAMTQQDMQNIPSPGTTCQMNYIPNIGFLFTVSGWNRTPPGDSDYPGMEFKFMNNDVRFYKSKSAIELDETIGDIHVKISNCENEIMLKLIRHVNSHAHSIFNAIELCAELDALISFSIAARNNNYVRPNVVEDQIISVKKGRHPLQELTHTFIPNDIFSGQGHSFIKILTGPNTSGKSVYLKEIALIVYMALIGSYVPAESATIGLMTHIFTQMPPINSISMDSSTFLQDLQQNNMALYSSTPSSLIIMDEFGQGTSQISGLCLLTAVLDSYAKRGVNCPHVFAATHLQRVVEKLSNVPLIEAQTFEHILNKNGTVTFLYRLIPGNVTCSFAHTAARGAGLSENLMKRALQVYNSQNEIELNPEIQRRYQLSQHIVENIAVPGVDSEELKKLVHQAVESTEE